MHPEHSPGDGESGILSSAMLLPSTEHLAQLSPAELVALVTELILVVRRLEAENQQLKEEMAKDRPPPPTSQHSSLPPSREVKRNLAAKRRRKKHGSPFGHARQTRAWVAEPDRILEAAGESCSYCQADLRGVEPRGVLRHQVTELPPLTPVVIETRQAEVVCPDCQRVPQLCEDLFGMTMSEGERARWCSGCGGPGSGHRDRDASRAACGHPQ